MMVTPAISVTEGTRVTRRMTGLPSTSIHSRFVREKEETGGGGTDDDEEEIDVEDEDDDDDEEEEEEEPKPFTKADGTPFTQKDYDALQLALKKARKDARAAKRTPASDEKTDDKAAVKAELVEEKWKGRYVRQTARAALSEAGLTGNPDRLLRLIDVDEVEVDDDGEVDGLDEQIDELKKEYPDLFRKARRSIDSTDKDPITKKQRSKMTASEIQAAQLRGDL